MCAFRSLQNLQIRNYIRARHQAIQQASKLASYKIFFYKKDSIRLPTLFFSLFTKKNKTAKLRKRTIFS